LRFDLSLNMCEGQCRGGDVWSRRRFIASGVSCCAGGLFSLTAQGQTAGHFPVSYTDAQWRERLTSRQYAILRGHGTEAPYSSPLNAEHRRGTFCCAGCDAALFSSATKYDSRTGWPSFWMPIAPDAVGQALDTSYGMIRTEIHCAQCGGHLGHVFSDGPLPTGLRYCMNGDAMTFKPV